MSWDEGIGEDKDRVWKRNQRKVIQTSIMLASIYFAKYCLFFCKDTCLMTFLSFLYGEIKGF